MIEFSEQGLVFDDPTQSVLIFQHSCITTVFDPDSQIEEATVFLKENEKNITFVYMGEAGDYVRLPGLETRTGNKWIGFACSELKDYDISGHDLLQLMQDIPKGTHAFYVYRGP